MAENTKEENDLSALKNLTISINSKGLEKLGYIYSIMEKLVIVEALEDLERLENEALLYLSSEKLLGKVFDQFGPLHKPFYTVRFDSSDEIDSKHISIDDDVFYLPTSTVTTQELSDSTTNQIQGQDKEKLLSSSFGGKEKSVKESVDAANHADNDRLLPEDSKYQNEDSVPAVTMREESKSQDKSYVTEDLVDDVQSTSSNESTDKAQPQVYQQPSQNVNPQQWVTGPPVYAQLPFQQIDPHMNNPNFRHPPPSLLGPYCGPLLGPPNMMGHQRARHQSFQPHYAMPYGAPQLYSVVPPPPYNNRVQNQYFVPPANYAYPVMIRPQFAPVRHQAALLQHQTAMHQYGQQFPAESQTPYSQGLPPGYIPPPRSKH